MDTTPSLSGSLSMAAITNYYGVDWVAMLLTLLAIYLIGNKSRSGFYVMILGNVAWIVLGIFTQSIAMIAANLLFAGMNTRAIYLWSTDMEEKD